MSLFQFGFPLRREQSSPGGSEGVEILESQLPRQEDTNLGVVDYKEAVATVADLSRPAEISQPNQVLKRKSGTYSHYCGEDCVKIGKFASENGNKKTLGRFAKGFPNLKENTVCIFKKSFCPSKRRKCPAVYVPCNAKMWTTTVALPGGQHFYKTSEQEVA